jgi:cell division FtsZ-interacting protein ZapD
VFHRLTHRIRLHRADDHYNHAVRSVVRLVELANRLDVKAGERVGMTQQRQSVRVLGEPLGEQCVAGMADGVGVVQGVLVAQDELSLPFQRVGG